MATSPDLFPKKVDARPQAPALLHGDLGSYRPYLRVVADQVLRSHRPYQARFDLSDVVQDALLKAHVHWNRGSRLCEARRRAWLRAILENTFWSRVREAHARRRNLRLERAIEEMIRKSTSRLHMFLTATTGSPSELAVRSERVEQLAHAIQALPRWQREAFLLHHCKGLRIGVVATQLDRSVPAITGLLRRALATLRKALETTDNQ